MEVNKIDLRICCFLIKLLGVQVIKAFIIMIQNKLIIILKQKVMIHLCHKDIENFHYLKQKKGLILEDFLHSAKVAITKTH